MKDYEKAYNDAMARLELVVRTGMKLDPAYIFPELAESKDERTRKEIVEFIRSQIEDGNSVGWDRWIAYLEKQKDASYAIEAVDRIDKYIDEHLANAHDMKDSNPDKKYYRGWDDALGKMAGILQDVYSDEKQKEPTTEELVYRLNGLMQEYIKEGKDEAEKEHRLKCYQLFWDALEDTNFFEQKEQKPAGWSEEDEDMLNSCISSIEEAKENRYAYKETDGDTSYDHEIAWLKSLRPQSKVEWDANDKAIVNCIVCCLDGQFVPEAARKQALVWFNKHRRDFLNRPSWKPSEDEERLINTSISFLKDFADKGYENAVECIDWLKSKLNGNSCK